MHELLFYIALRFKNKIFLDKINSTSRDTKCRPATNQCRRLKLIFVK